MRETWTVIALFVGGLSIWELVQWCSGGYTITAAMRDLDQRVPFTALVLGLLFAWLIWHLYSR